MMDAPIREKAVELAAAAPTSEEWRDRRSIGMFNRRAHPSSKISARSDLVDDRCQAIAVSRQLWIIKQLACDVNATWVGSRDTPSPSCVHSMERPEVKFAHCRRWIDRQSLNDVPCHRSFQVGEEGPRCDCRFQR
jgi:hypothetical protein